MEGHTAQGSVGDQSFAKDATSARSIARFEWKALLDEWRLIGPIVACWFGIWLPLTIFSIRGGYSAAREYALAVTCFIGIATTVLWSCLYGTFSLRRVGGGLLLIVVTSTIADSLVAGFSPNGNQSGFFVIGVLFVALLAFAPGWCLRRFFKWQICKFSELSFENDRQIRIQEIFYWTAAAAGFLALLPMFVEILFSSREASVSFIASFVTLVVVIPTLVTMTYFTLLSRLQDRHVLIAIPLLAIVVGLLIALFLAMTGQNGTLVDVMRNEFWPISLSFGITGYVILLMVRYLRSRGLYFKVGLVNHRECARRAKQDYEDSLRRRIAKISTLPKRLEESQAIDIDAIT